MDDEQKAQEKMLKIQILEQQIAAVQKQLQNFENQMMDLKMTKESLEELKKSKTGAEMLSMLSPGIFVKTSLKDNKDIIINVGGNVAVKKNVDEAKELVDTQAEEIKKIQAQLIDDMQKLDNAILNIEKEV